MISYNELLKKIDQIQCGESYCIDIFPYKISLNPTRYFKLEQWLLENEIQDFAKKIFRIVMKLSVYDYAVVCLTQLPEGKGNELLKSYLNRVIDDISYEELSKIICEVMINDISSVQVYSQSSNVLISINGGFSVDVYGLYAEDSNYKLLESLVQSEGLFLWKD